MDNLAFVLKCEALIRERGISKADFYKACDISSSAFSQWRKGKSTPAMTTVNRIAEYFKVPAGELVLDEIKKPSILEGSSNAARRLAALYDSLDAHGQRMVDTVAYEEARRMDIEKPTKLIPLFGASFAAGVGEPDFGTPWEQYEIDADSAAEFAIRVHGDSMLPYLEDGGIALGKHGKPKDGDVAALLVDGAFFVKQVAHGADGNLYLLSLNRARKDMDKIIYANGGSSVTCFGVIILPKRIPLPEV